jgi:hypothetical protein
MDKVQETSGSQIQITTMQKRDETNNVNIILLSIC